MADKYATQQSTGPLPQSTLDRRLGELEESLTVLEDGAISLSQYLTRFRGSRPEVAANQKDTLSQGNYLARLERLVERMHAFRDQFAQQTKELHELG